MANNNKHTGPNVPALRFPEFSGEWERYRLDECVTFLDEKRKPIKSSDRVSEKGLYPYYGASGIIDRIDNYIFDDDLVLLSEDGANILDRNYRVAFIVRGKAWINNHAHVLKPNCHTDIVFLSESLERIDYAPYNTGTTMPKLNQEVCRGIMLYMPTPTEQAKIGSLLKLVNERIEAQSKIIEELMTLRSALHQGIMSTGLEDGSWRMQTLDEVLSERTELNNEGHAVHSVSVSKGIVNQIEYLGRSFAAKDTSRYHVAYPGDVIYTKSPTGEFPYGIVKQSQISIKAALSPLYGVYVPISPEIGYIIHNHFLSAKNALNYLHPLIQKGAKNTINITNQRFLQNSMPLPSSNSVARLYFKTIKTLSDKIDLEISILHQLQIQKRKLLNDMFI